MIQKCQTYRNLYALPLTMLLLSLEFTSHVSFIFIDRLFYSVNTNQKSCKESRKKDHSQESRKKFS